MTVALSVNLNKIALIRNSREGNYPNLIEHAMQCIACGVDGITVHPRPDQRHIRPDDVRQLKTLLAEHPAQELNVEGNPFADPYNDYPGFLPLVLETRPDQCTLVPDSNQQLTSDHGFDLLQWAEKLHPIIEQLQAADIRVNLFMDPDVTQIALAKQLGADRIELYTGPYAAAWHTENREALWQQHCEAAEQAKSLNLGLNAGHDLNLHNLARYASLPGLLEVSIGHALTVDAIAMGLPKAIAAYQHCLQKN